MRHSHRANAGVTLLELLVSMTFVGVSLVIMLQQIALSHHEMLQEDQRLFAHRKAMAMLSELQASVDQGVINNPAQLTRLADLQPNPLLTTRSSSIAPDHPMSGNVRLANGNWKYRRTVRIDPILGSEQARYTHVQIERHTEGGSILVEAAAGGVLNLPATAYPATKQYDVYVLALAAAPSLWMPTGPLRAMLQAEALRIQQDNPGLSFRLRFITELGYGRDPLYAPFVNDKLAADQAAPWAYTYPGRLGAGQQYSALYASANFRGRVRNEAGFVNDFDAAKNPFPHTVADRFNHCMRTPAARQRFAQRVATGQEDPDAPPLHLLLADLHDDPARYRNAIFINLHGEGLPCPPLRNYSDPAKLPQTLPGVRVVTHPTRLHTARDPDGDGDASDSADVALQVYAYHTDPGTAPAVLGQPITVQLAGLDPAKLTDIAASLDVRCTVGGVDPATGSTSSGNLDYAVVTPPTTAPVGVGMWYEVGTATTPDAHIWLRLHNTPLIAPAVNGRGLPASQRLYGMDYVPAPLADGLDAVGTGPKNTARWSIRVPPGAQLTWLSTDRMVTVRTRIGANASSGQAWPTAIEPHNHSETYTWWTRSALSIPLTERFQFLGDPRHSPYADLAAGGSSFPHGYNWFFDDLQDGAVDASAAWPVVDATRLRHGFGLGVTADVPRLVQVWREALQASTAVFLHANGRLAQYALLGGEAGLPPSSEGAMPAAVRCAGDLYAQPGPVSPAELHPGTASHTVPTVGQPLIVDRDTAFWCKPWLGELFPDAVATQYGTDGNLACGNSPRFYRVGRGAASLAGLPAGTSFAVPSSAALGAHGGATVLQIGSPATRFQHESLPVETMLAAVQSGADILQAAGYENHAITPGWQPYRADQALPVPLPQDVDPAAFPDLPADFLGRFSEAPNSLAGGGVIRLRNPLSTEAAYFALASDTAISGEHHALLLRRSFLFALRAFHEGGAGSPGQPELVPQVPLLEITAPRPPLELSAPTSVQLTWRTLLQRFDGEPLTTPNAEANYIYVISHSPAGQPFRYIGKPGLATPGQLPTDPSLWIYDASPGEESFVLPLSPVEFPTGDYTIRVECFDRTRAQHSAYHQVNISIVR